MKKSLSALLSAVALPVLAVPNYGINGTFDRLIPWRSSQQSASKIQLHKIVQDNGSSCLEITGDPANPANDRIVLGAMIHGIKAGTTYTVKFRYKAAVTAPDKNKSFKIRVPQYDARNKLLNNQTVLFFYDKEGWQNFEFAITGAADVKNAWFHIETVNLTTADKLLIDDIQITEVPHADRGLVTNGGFELGIAPWFSHQQGGGWRQIHTLSGDTPFGDRCLEITGDVENTSNRLIILNQPLPKLETGIPYKLSLQFRSKVKEEPGPTKTVYLRVQQLGSKGEYILGNELHFPLDHDLWTYRELTFIPDPRTDKILIYICSGNLKDSDKFYIDEVTVHKAVAPGAPFDPAKAAKPAKITEISSDRGTAKIDAATGVLASLTIDGKTIIPAAEKSTVIYAQQNDSEEILNGKNTPGNKFPFKAAVEYAWINGEFREIVTIEATEDARGPFKIGVRHGLKQNDWQKQVFGLFPVRVIPAAESTVFTYGGDANDLNLTQLDLYQGVIMPLQIMESDSAYLAIASHNYDDTITFRPNIPAGYTAALERNPLSVKKGDKFRFELNINLFSRSKFMLRDVWRDQIFKLYTNRPELKPYIPVRDPGPRVTVNGPFGSVTGMIQSRINRLFPGSAIWEGWHDVPNEEFPTSGSWWSGSNGWAKPYTAESFKEHIRHCQEDLGLSVIAYVRTFCNLDYAGDRYPATWTRRTAGGGLQLYGGGYRVQLPKHVAESTGLKEVVWGMLDTFQPGCLEYVIKRVMNVVDFYHPWAIGWDCAGFGPEDFLAVAAVTRNLRDKGYSTKVVGNECVGPICAYLDWTMIENGFFGGKTPYDFEVARALPIPVTCLERFNLAEDIVELFLYNKRTWVRPYGKEWSFNYLRYITGKYPQLKEKANQKTLEHHMQMTWYYKDLALGAPAGFMEECKPVPPSMIKMCSNTNAIIRMDTSFALRFPNGLDNDGNLCACAWADSKTNMFRLAGYNDAATTQKFRLTLDKEAFAAVGWSMEDVKNNAKAYFADPEGEKEVTLKYSMDNGNLVIECDLPAYTAIFVMADK